MRMHEWATKLFPLGGRCQVCQQWQERIWPIELELCQHCAGKIMERSEKGIEFVTMKYAHFGTKVIERIECDWCHMDIFYKLGKFRLHVCRKCTWKAGGRRGKYGAKYY